MGSVVRRLPEGGSRPTMFMPDLSDVGPPATGPGLPERIPDAPPPPVKIHIQHKEGCEATEEIIREIMLVTPEAQITTEVDKDENALEIKINGKLMFSKKVLGTNPIAHEVAEIVKWGNEGKSFLHM